MIDCASIEEFVAAAREESSAAALAALYDSAAGKLLLYGKALGLSHSEAEDVLHDVFAALLKSSQMPENPEHYLIRAFRNRALNHRRGWWRRLARELESSRWFEPTNPESPHEAAAVRCLTQLPVEQREVIVLKFWYGYTFEEIAVFQEVAANTAAGRYRYGLQKLRACLALISNESDIDDETIPQSRIDSPALEFAGVPSTYRGPS